MVRRRIFLWTCMRTSTLSLVHLNCTSGICQFLSSHTMTTPSSLSLPVSTRVWEALLRIVSVVFKSIPCSSCRALCICKHLCSNPDDVLSFQTYTKLRPLEFTNKHWPTSYALGLRVTSSRSLLCFALFSELGSWTQASLLILFWQSSFLLLVGEVGVMQCLCTFLRMPHKALCSQEWHWFLNPPASGFSVWGVSNLTWFGVLTLLKDLLG